MFRDSPNSTTPFTPFFTDASVPLDSLPSDVTSPTPVVPSSPESVSSLESPTPAPTASSNLSDQHQTYVPSSQPTIDPAP